MEISPAKPGARRRPGHLPPCRASCRSRRPGAQRRAETPPSEHALGPRRTGVGRAARREPGRLPRRLTSRTTWRPAGVGAPAPGRAQSIESGTESEWWEPARAPARESAMPSSETPRRRRRSRQEIRCRASTACRDGSPTLWARHVRRRDGEDAPADEPVAPASHHGASSPRRPRRVSIRPTRWTIKSRDRLREQRVGGQQRTTSASEEARQRRIGKREHDALRAAPHLGLPSHQHSSPSRPARAQPPLPSSSPPHLDTPPSSVPPPLPRLTRTT